jgi:LPXTG-site transpeptidase (sortase) family protein
VTGATWVRNLGIIVVLFAVWQLWGTGFAEARSQSRLGAQYGLLVQAGARKAAPEMTTVTSVPAAGLVGPGAAGADEPSVNARSASTASTKASAKAAAALRRGHDARHGAGPRSGALAARHTRAALPAKAALEAKASLRAETAAFGDATVLGGVLGHIRIPAIEVSDYFVEGVGEAQLQEGPGRYPGTGIPGQAGNLAIAGHRTTYGAPFFRLGELRAGDQVIIDVPQGRAIYTVSEPPFAVSPYDVDVLDDFGDARLTLTTCNPPFLATTRLIVVAKLTQWLPEGAQVAVAPVAPASRSGARRATAPAPSTLVPTTALALTTGPVSVVQPGKVPPGTTVPVLDPSGPVPSGPVPAARAAGPKQVDAAATVGQAAASEGNGWHLGRLPLVLAVVVALAALGALYERAARFFAGASRWLVMAPLWLAGLLALFKVLGLLLPADL